MTRVRPSTRKGASARRAGASMRSSGSLDAASIRATQAIYAAAMLEEPDPGSTIIAWLVRSARDLERSSTLVLKIGSAARRPRPGASRLSDGELVAACETWLSAGAIP